MVTDFAGCLAPQATAGRVEGGLDLGAGGPDAGGFGLSARVDQALDQRGILPQLLDGRGHGGRFLWGDQTCIDIVGHVVGDAGDVWPGSRLTTTRRARRTRAMKRSKGRGFSQ